MIIYQQSTTSPIRARLFVKISTAFSCKRLYFTKNYKWLQKLRLVSPQYNVTHRLCARLSEDLDAIEVTECIDCMN